MQKHLLPALLVLLFHAGMAQQRRVQHICPYTLEMHKDGGRQVISYAANFRPNKTDTSIRTLLVYIHGLHRNALSYFDYAMDAVRSAGQKKTTLIIAPQYVNEEDPGFGSDFLYWHKAGWKDGYASVPNDRKRQQASMSSYEVLDSLVTAVLGSGNFPNIAKVIIAGHSAGGQFVQRYSAITPLPDLFTALKFRFIVMNPSSYLYPDNKRPDGNGDFVVPDSNGCMEYNRYPKGLTGLNAYAQITGPDRIVRQMLQRDIVILVGGEDTRIDDPDLDVSCQANLQGQFRLQRALYFIAHIASFPEYGVKKNYNIVKGYSHEGDMIGSNEAIKWIFGW